MMMYEAHYSLYGCENIIQFRGFSQYLNWSAVMEENFEEHFEIHRIIDLEVERLRENGNHD